MNKCFQFIVTLGALWIFSTFAFAQAELRNVKFFPLPSNQVKAVLTFSEPIAEPQSFTTKDPARVVFDFAKAVSKLDTKDTHQEVGVGVVTKFTAVEAEGRVRAIFDVQEVIKYSVHSSGNQMVVLFSGGEGANRLNMSEKRFPIAPPLTTHMIRNIDFTSGNNHLGKVIIGVSDPNVTAEVEKKGDDLIVNFLRTGLPTYLRHTLDVKDFGTPATTISCQSRGGNTTFIIHTRNTYEHFTYQLNRKFILELQPQVIAKKPTIDEKVYTGKRISLNFQDIKVRAALQLIAEFTKLNVVVSDTVNGNVTLRLNRVPWDQALDIILRTRGLDQRRFGSVILIAPATEIAAQEKEELQAKKEVGDLAPLTSALIQVNYAKAASIAALLKDKGTSLLSSRGNVSVDERTNTLWLQDNGDKLEEIRRLVKKLDVPVRQVLIESRIVIVNKDSETDLGVRFGVTKPEHFTGTLTGANSLVAPTPPESVALANRLNVDLPVAGKDVQVPSIALALAKLGKGYLLDLELSALESEGKGEVISSPRLITANQQSATIMSGEEIPYLEASSSGAATVAFKKAVLSLKVTPQITPDNRIILDLVVNQDTPSNQLFNGVPSILTKQIQTNVLVDNGQTVVLGGIYRQTKTSAITRVPFLGRIPVFGALFRNTNKLDKREELLIFVTPKIVQESRV